MDPTVADPLAKNLLILASAGSGKTYQLSRRVIALMARGVPPSHISALTFTRKAAGEFTDNVLNAISAAASDPAAAARLRAEAKAPEACFPTLLERMVKALPALAFGTMDSFFSRVIRSFQYELGITGGRVSLLEGPGLDAAREELLEVILTRRLARDQGDGFFHAFRRAMTGREEVRVAEGLRGFVRTWQGVYRERAGDDWGPPALAGVEPGDWETRKHGLVERVRKAFEGFEGTDKRQPAGVEKALDTLAAHTIGSGGLSGAASLLGSLLGAIAASPGDAALELRFHKDFTVPFAASQPLRELVTLAARCELAAALVRTRGVRGVIAVYDELCEERLRRHGLLGFDDIKFLMGRWSRDETSRLRREAVDFRLGARYGHWLLDEFQDTSRSDWLGLEPLVEEAASDDTGSLFIVGDRKQAIYAWRGGDVTIFDEIQRRYAGNLAVTSMAESWRSCPEVLALVNRVCGDHGLIGDIFGAEAAARWQWQDHESARPLATPEKRGEARAEVVPGGTDARMERLVELLRELGAGRHSQSFGVLLRDNSDVGETAALLRKEGFDVVEDGHRHPAEDHPVGVTLAHAFSWLADPANAYARGILAMSPLGHWLLEKHGDWHTAWNAATAAIATQGMAATAAAWIDACGAGWSAFARRRTDDLIAALHDLESAGPVTPREAAHALETLQIPQPSGAAAIQVMTVHKAKGLGFDIVILPDIPADSVPKAGHFEIAAANGWLTETPPKWARDIIPELRDAESRWAAAQRYEAMCLLYVALTRAKRGLYLLLDPAPEKREDDHASLANWLDRALNPDGGAGIVWQQGDASWLAALPPSAAAAPTPPPRLAPATPRRARLRPSGTARASGPAATTGRLVHSIFQQIGWIDETPPVLPDSSSGRMVAALLEIPEIRSVFERRGEALDLFREQTVDAIVDDRWLSGMIDRLHLLRDPGGHVIEARIHDFKTDAVANATELIARHRTQMAAYRDAIALSHRGAPVSCTLVSTHLGILVPVF